MKKTLLLLNLVFLANVVFSQNPFSVNVAGIKEKDSILIILQKNTDIKVQKWVQYSPTGTTKADFNLGEGEWAIIVDATGYTFPTATVVNIPEVNNASVTLTPLLNQDYIYNWEDDDSYAGHATQVYINEPSDLVVLNDTLSVPSDYSSIKLRNEFGVVLSNDKSYWSSEDSYRLYSILKTLPVPIFGEGSEIDFESGNNLQAVFYLTEEEQYKDISIDNINGVKNVTISQSAFTYSNPQIGALDGIKVKFYSKRLHHALLNYYTDFGFDIDKINQVAQERYGVRFMQSNQETEDIMGEDSSNFQEFFTDEKIEILSMFEEMPDGFHKIEGLKYLVRRINGQDNPTYPDAAAIAWGGSNTIEFMSKAFNSVGIEEVRRIILHEKAHFLWFYTFDEQTKDDWIDIGGWFLDPTSGSGWSTYNTTEFVSAYGHDLNPNEDMAESIAAYITNPDILMARSMRKYEFIRDRIMHGTRYKAQIREDLTFAVYNLFPDYTYPGKITSVNINVKGNPEEDKEVTIKVSLNASDVNLEGANVVSIRLVSLMGTIHDIQLSPENGSLLDSVLVGSTTFNKFEKNGYWNIKSCSVVDLVGNQRYENTSTIGFKLYIENPLEDIVSPKWNYDLTMEVVNGKFLEGYTTFPSDDGVEMNAVKINYSFYDDITIPNQPSVRVMHPTLDDVNAQVYERNLQAIVIVDESLNKENGFKSVKYLETYLGIPEYFPSGYYAVSEIYLHDEARNYSRVYFSKDTTDFKANNLTVFKDVRDSIYVSTLYPDYIAPEIDVNNITITALPANPTSPDGETRVDINVIARDLSDYIGKESGITEVNLTLKDPLGNLHGYNTGNSTMNHPDLDLTRNDFSPDNNSDWRSLNFNFVLPKGSPPGKWGISSMQAVDKAGNFKNYSFVEYIRFDIIESEVNLTEPLKAQILNKYVNANSVESISVGLSCSPCEGKKYINTVYSLMGGNVVRNEGVFTKDSITINNINLSGVLDGVIKLTVQVTDSLDQLIATTTADYTKDTVLPKAYYSQSNLQNDGESNLDDFIVEIVLEKVEIGGVYKLEFDAIPNSKYSAKNSSKSMTSSSSAVVYDGAISGNTFTLNNIDLNSLNDGIIKSSLTIIDQNDNTGETEVIYYLKLDNKISLIGSQLLDTDLDGVYDSVDTCANTPTGETVNDIGCSDSQTLAIDELEQLEGVILYPNPSSDTIVVEGLNEKSNVRIYNVLGKMVFEKKDYQVELIDVSTWSNGIFVVHISNNSGKTVKKIVKN